MDRESQSIYLQCDIEQINLILESLCAMSKKEWKYHLQGFL